MTRSSLILDAEKMPGDEIRFRILDRHGSNAALCPASMSPATQVIDRAKRLTRCAQNAVSIDEAREQGARLYDALVPASIKATLNRIGDGDILLRLDPWCDRLPWELLHTGKGFLGTCYRIGRVVTTPDDGENGAYLTPQDSRSGSSAVMLIVGKRLEGLDSLDHEAAEIQRLLSQTDAVRELVGYRDDADGETCAGYFSRYRVIHFCGHSEWTGDERSSGLLLDDGLFPLTRIRRLRDSAHLPELVFLNSCDSCASSAGPMLAGFHAAFLASGIPWLIGCTGKVDDQFAARFGVDFYRGLAATNDILEALRGARTQAEHAMWGLYRLYGDPHGRDTREHVHITAPKHRRRIVELAQLAGIVLVALASVLLVLYLIGARLEGSREKDGRILFVP